MNEGTKGAGSRLIDDLPEQFRVVFVMRAVEEMSVEETARTLQLQPETVRTRLHRADRVCSGRWRLSSPPR
jgi:RNA polymerase sigma factor (sigma-70 family)